MEITANTNNNQVRGRGEKKIKRVNFSFSDWMIDQSFIRLE